MRPAFRTQETRQGRRIPGGFAAAGHLAVQNAQGVGLPPPQAVRAQALLARGQEIQKGAAEIGPAGRAAQGIDMGLGVGDAQPFQQFHQHDDQLDIGIGRAHPEYLGVDLVKLPIAPLLGPLATKHRPDGVVLLNRILGVDLVLQIGPHHGGRGLGAQGQQIAAAVGEGVHLLFDDVRGFPDAAGKKLGFLQDGQTDFAEPEGAQNFGGRFFDGLPERGFARQDVLETLYGSDAGHGCHCARVRFRP